MARNCFIHMRDYGPLGWHKLLPALLISDRVDTWVPSGENLEEARKSGLRLAQDEFIHLVTIGLVRVGVREENIVRGSTRPVFHERGDTHLDHFLQHRYEAGDSEHLIVHPQYDSAAVALEEIAKRRESRPDSRYNIARWFLDQHLADRRYISDIVFQRATEFGTMPVDKIFGSEIRECMELIREVPQPEERQALLVCSQLIRLAVEHEHLIQAHGCDTYVTPGAYAATFRTVAKAQPFQPTTGASISATLEQILELLDFLLVETETNNLHDFLERRNHLEKYKPAIWDLACFNKDIDEYLLQQIDVPKQDSSGMIELHLSAADIAIGVFALLEGAYFGGGAGLGIGLLSLVRAMRRWTSNPETRTPEWLAVAVYGTPRPSYQQLINLRKMLEFHIFQKRIL
jgi:hypothetical protein